MLLVTLSCCLKKKVTHTSLISISNHDTLKTENWHEGVMESVIRKNVNILGWIIICQESRASRILHYVNRFENKFSVKQPVNSC